MADPLGGTEKVNDNTSSNEYTKSLKQTAGEIGLAAGAATVVGLLSNYGGDAATSTSLVLSGMTGVGAYLGIRGKGDPVAQPAPRAEHIPTEGYSGNPLEEAQPRHSDLELQILKTVGQAFNLTDAEGNSSGQVEFDGKIYEKSVLASWIVDALASSYENGKADGVADLARELTTSNLRDEVLEALSVRPQDRKDEALVLQRYDLKTDYSPTLGSYAAYGEVHGIPLFDDNLSPAEHQKLINHVRNLVKKENQARATGMRGDLEVADPRQLAMDFIQDKVQLVGRSYSKVKANWLAKLKKDGRMDEVTRGLSLVNLVAIKSAFDEDSHLGAVPERQETDGMTDEERSALPLKNSQQYVDTMTKRHAFLLETLDRKKEILERETKIEGHAERAEGAYQAGEVLLALDVMGDENAVASLAQLASGRTQKRRNNAMLSQATNALAVEARKVSELEASTDDASLEGVLEDPMVVEDRSIVEATGADEIEAPVVVVESPQAVEPVPEPESTDLVPITQEELETAAAVLGTATASNPGVIETHSALALRRRIESIEDLGLRRDVKRDAPIFIGGAGIAAAQAARARAEYEDAAKNAMASIYFPKAQREWNDTVLKIGREDALREERIAEQIRKQSEGFEQFYEDAKKDGNKPVVAYALALKESISRDPKVAAVAAVVGTGLAGLTGLVIGAQPLFTQDYSINEPVIEDGRVVSTRTVKREGFVSGLDLLSNYSGLKTDKQLELIAQGGNTEGLESEMLRGRLAATQRHKDYQSTVVAERKNLNDNITQERVAAANTAKVAAENAGQTAADRALQTGAAALDKHGAQYQAELVKLKARQKAAEGAAARAETAVAEAEKRRLKELEAKRRTARIVAEQRANRKSRRPQ